MCTVCQEVDGVEHHLFYCKESKKIWSNLKLWMIAKRDRDRDRKRDRENKI